MKTPDNQNKLYDKNIWTLVSQSKKELENRTKIGVMEIVNSRGIHRHLLYWYCINDYCTDSKVLVKFIKALHRIAHNDVELKFTAILSESLSETMMKDLANMLNATTKEHKS